MAKKTGSAEKPPKEKGKKSWMILGTGLSVLAGIATTKALDATWKAATGREPPNAPGSSDICQHRQAGTQDHPGLLALLLRRLLS